MLLSYLPTKRILINVRDTILYAEREHTAAQQKLFLLHIPTRHSNIEELVSMAGYLVGMCRVGVFSHWTKYR